jgi:hypothetical protein
LAAKRPALTHGKLLDFSLKSMKVMVVMKSSPMVMVLVKALPANTFGKLDM